MEAAYCIVLAHHNRDVFARQVESAVKTAAQELLIDCDLLEFTTQLAEPKTHQVVVYLGSEDGHQCDELNQIVDTALRWDVAILPVIESCRSNVIAGLPKDIAQINAALWRGNGAGVAASLLAILGLVEKERKLFISYRRSETSELSMQLHSELVNRRFNVFLDRFSLEPGVDFQRRLDEELGDKAFLLVLESNALRESEWVRHEISYAHSRRIEMLALTLPDTDRVSLIPTIDDAFRHRLRSKDFSHEGILLTSVLEKILEKIELAHARALRRRREQILGSITEKLRMDGCECNPTGDWSIFASGKDGHAGVFWVTPRCPEPRDFYLLSLQHDRVSQQMDIESLQSTVVHEAGVLAKEHEELLDWLSNMSNQSLATIATCSVGP